MSSVPSRRGLFPGQTHSGSFKKGYDPRRNRAGVRLDDGRTLSALARTKTAECVQLMFDTVSDPKQPTEVRIKTAQYILERGWGKAMQSIEVNLPGSDRPVTQMTNEELAAIAAGHVYEGEYSREDDDEA